jgi:hypothetical protein
MRDSWEPISLEELLALIQAQGARCPSDQLERFQAFRVEPRKVGIERLGTMEQVFVVAQRGEEVVWFDDVEDGFQISVLCTDGNLPPGFVGQYEFHHVIHRWCP